MVLRGVAWLLEHASEWDIAGEETPTAPPVVEPTPPEPEPEPEPKLEPEPEPEPDPYIYRLGHITRTDNPEYRFRFRDLTLEHTPDTFGVWGMEHYSFGVGFFADIPGGGGEESRRHLAWMSPSGGSGRSGVFSTDGARWRGVVVGTFAFVGSFPPADIARYTRTYGVAAMEFHAPPGGERHFSLRFSNLRGLNPDFVPPFTSFGFETLKADDVSFGTPGAGAWGFFKGINHAEAAGYVSHQGFYGAFGVTRQP